MITVFLLCGNNRICSCAIIALYCTECTDKYYIYEACKPATGYPSLYLYLPSSHPDSQPGPVGGSSTAKSNFHDDVILLDDGV